jgi:four helix bundle protein
MKNPKFEVRSSKCRTQPRRSGAASLLPALGSTIPCSCDWPAASLEGSCFVIHDGPTAKHPTIQDLEERATVFAERILRFARKIPKGPVTNRLIDQLVGSGTSIGANYVEARDAVSRKDFKKRVGTSRKESREVMYFLRLIAGTEEALASEARDLWREARELNRIFGAIWRKCDE